MKEEVKQKAGIVYNVVESVILAMSVGLMVWLANVVIDQGKLLATHDSWIITNTRRIDRIETSGSPSLISHEKEDTQRVADLSARVTKLENAVLLLQTIPGRLDSVDVGIKALHEGQARIETHFDQFMRDKYKP